MIDVLNCTKFILHCAINNKFEIWKISSENEKKNDFFMSSSHFSIFKILTIMLSWDSIVQKHYFLRITIKEVMIKKNLESNSQN